MCEDKFDIPYVRGKATCFSSSHIQMWVVGPKRRLSLKNWSFQIVVLEKTLESPLDASRSNQSILKEINPVYSFEGLMLKIKLQYFSHLMRRANSMEKTLMLERLRTRGDGDDRGLNGWMASPTQWTWVWANSGRWWRTGKPNTLQSTSSQRVRYNWATEETFVIACLPRSKYLLILWLQSSSAVILDPKKIKSVTVFIFSPFICHEVMGSDAMILVFWMLSFMPVFSLSSFTLIRRLFSFSSLSAIRVISSAYLRLLIFLLAILIPACASSSLAFHMMYSA